MDMYGKPVETPVSQSPASAVSQNAAMQENGTDTTSSTASGPPSPQGEGYRGGGDVVDLSNDTALAQRVEGLYGAEKYKKIQQYILEVLGDQPITLSDGKQAIVDRSDALHIANRSGAEKTAQISRIKELVETAELYAEDRQPVHNKFNYFCYYKADVRYEGEVFPLYLNVGRGKADGQYHLYDITKKIRDTAHRINGVGRPKPNEGYALENGISTHSIRDTSRDVKRNSFQNGTYDTEAVEAARDVEGVIEALGDEEAYRRLHFASQIDRPTGTVALDGMEMPATEYAQRVYEALPNDPDSIRAAQAETTRALGEELIRLQKEGQTSSPTSLRLNIQLFAQKAKLDYVLDPGENGNKARQFYEKRLRGDIKKTEPWRNVPGSAILLYAPAVQPAGDTSWDKLPVIIGSQYLLNLLCRFR